MSYERSLCKAVMNFAPNESTAGDQVFVVPDLTLDDTFKNHPDVTEFPNLRFLATTPIISPKGVVIGAYTILDDKPHDQLDIGQLKFLADVSATVMHYLDINRIKAQHLRSERMIVGLGSFIEGKGSLRNSWLVDTDNAETALGENNHAEGNINLDQQQVQVSQSMIEAMRHKPASSHLPFRPYNLHIPRSKTPQAENAKDNSPSSPDTIRRHAEAQSRLDRASQAAISNGDEQVRRQQSPKDGYTAKLQQTFSRAANIIRESIEVEAVVFFSANFGSQEALVNNAKSDTEESSLESCSSGEDDVKSRGSSSQSEALDAELAGSSGKETLNSCEILGFSTSNASSINDQVTDDNKIALSESFLAGLLHRYPRGKIFNFSADGARSSDDTSEGVFSKYFRRTRGKRYKRTRKTLLRRDALTLLQLAPESRSIVFTPMWDSHKGRWYAGSISWTRAAHRVFTSDDELAFLLTIGNSIMAEVHRLGAHFAERAKSDLLAGLSHELRSPLHGIFGTAELLSDTVMDGLQRGFVHTISSCAFTLLGSINQLLEYAGINDIRPSSVAKTPGGTEIVTPGASRSPTHRLSYTGKVDIDTYVELDSAVEEAIETVFAGYSFLSNSRSPLRVFAGHSTTKGKSFDTGGVKVILDIDYAKSWKFSTRPGAWHVILTNIFGNALKFTQKGHIHVSVRATPAQYGAGGEVVSSNLYVSIKDTGCGMDPEYLKNGLFTAFSQEDSMTTGNGLGFNITRRIIESLGGHIQAHSQKDVGTEVVVTVTLDHIFERGVPDHTDGPFSIANTKEFTRTKSVGILGLGTSDLDTALRVSLQKVCRDWLAMDVCFIAPSQTQFSHCDFYISPHEHLDIGNLEIQAIAPDPNKRFASPVIVICPSPKIAHSMFAGARRRREADVHEFISQPCGPRKLAKTFETCIKRQQERMNSLLSKAETGNFPTDTPSPVGLDLPRRDSLAPSPIQDINGHPMITIPDATARTQSWRFSNSPEPPIYSHDPIYNPDAISGDHVAVIPNNNDPLSGPESNIPLMVLLVDDNDINLRLLIAFMKKLKCDYGIAQNGEEALQFFKSNHHSIGMILMGTFSQFSTDNCKANSLTDISMPVMDGLESARRIREFENTLETESRVTIAALTGLAQADVQRDAIGSGMDFFMTKPVRLDNLVPIIKGVFPRSHAIWHDQA
jgi:signal transduction histidine kinase/CheY-like chemotaxis protein